MDRVLDRVRQREYPEPREGIFLDTAGYGLLPRSAARAVTTLAEARTRVRGVVDDLDLGPALDRARQAVGRLLDVPAAEVSLAPNTSYGVNLAAALAATGEPGTVLLSEGEFPTNVYPWMALRRRGFDVEIVPADPRGLPDESALLERVRRSDVRVLAASAVQFASGYRMDLGALGEACRAHGVLFAVDAIQALGAVPLHPRELGIDVLASGAQKWLCSPWGSGFVWMEARHRDRVEPPMVSWLAMDASMDFENVVDYRWELLDDGRRFELATLGIQDYVGMTHALDMFLEVGVERVEAWLRRLQEPLLAWLTGRADVEGLTPTTPDRRAGIVAFRPPAPADAGRGLAKHGVVASVREGAVRLAPHLYTTEAEIERVVEILDAVI